jgi:aerobic carbon-monoxide dehydrogenase large subunit
LLRERRENAGVRGAGEVGTIPVAAAVANAICDALSDFGVEIDRLPITPELVWRALRESGHPGTASRAGPGRLGVGGT